jgi:hypothetical protein
MISCTLRRIVRSGDSSIVLTTCWVIVEPPWAVRPRSTFSMKARSMPR